MSIVLSEDQELACDVLIQAIIDGQRILVLTGPAGTGKTTLMQELSRRVKLQLGWSVEQLASTGKAALRLTEVTGVQTNTIHGKLFKFVKDNGDGVPVFMDPQSPCSVKTLLIVDEASMVDEHLYGVLNGQLPKNCAVLYCGDRDQLPPVLGKWGPNFEDPTAVLTHIHRQALENPVVGISANIRAGGRLPMESVGDQYLRMKGTYHGVASWVAKQQDAGDDIVVLCWTNKTRQKINKIVRRVQALDRAPFVVGDRLLVLKNSKQLGKMNGEVCTITALTPFPESPGMGHAEFYQIPPTDHELESFYVELDGKTRAYISPNHIGATYQEFREFSRGGSRVIGEKSWLHVDYGQALTVHKSQGSEFRTVVFVADDSAKWLAKRDTVMARHLTYTAITRAKHRFVVFDVD